MGTRHHCGHIHRRGQWCGDCTRHVCRAPGGGVEVTRRERYSGSAAGDARHCTLGGPRHLQRGDGYKTSADPAEGGYLANPQGILAPVTSAPELVGRTACRSLDQFAGYGSPSQNSILALRSGRSQAGCQRKGFAHCRHQSSDRRACHVQQS